MVISYLLLGITAIFATLVKSIGGFGFAIIFMSMASILVPIKQATVISLSTVFFVQTYIMIRLYKHIHWKLVIVPAICGIISGTIGVHVMLHISNKLMDLILGIFLWVMAAFLIFVEPKLDLKGNHVLFGGLAGIISGFMRGLFAVGTPPIAIYYNAALEDPLAYQATIQTYLNITTINILIDNVISHNFSKALIFPLSFTITGCLIGTIIGMRLLHKVSMSFIRRISYTVMLLAGAYNFIKFFI